MTERRKKLIEVALPLAAINKASAREKSIRHGHPSTLHLWWARRPLAACRAVLFAQFVDDPSSDPCYCRGGVVDEEAAGVKRAELFNLIEELVIWENSNNPKVINAARAEIARCVASRKIELGELKQATVIFGRDEGQDHPEGPISNQGVTAYEIVLMRCRPEVVNHFLATYAPPVLDPFCGGGSIPLEAQRLGLRSHASDLNPVPVLITKAMIEIPPTFAGMQPVHPKAEQRTAWHGAEGLAADVRYYGQWMRDEADKRIGHLYPKVKITQEMIDARRDDLKPYLGQELTVIAWLWTRTVASPDPAMQGKHVPLVRSFWLSKKKGKEAYVQPIIDHANGTYEFQVKAGTPKDGFDPDNGTVVRTGGTCLVSGAPMPFAHVRNEGKAGRMHNRLMAIVCEGARGRAYIAPDVFQEKTADCGLPDDYPVTDIPIQALSFRVQLYGMDEHWKLFTPRQLTALVTFSDLVAEARQQVLADMTGCDWLPDDNRPLAEGGTGPQAYADAIATYLAFSASKCANFWGTICTWATGGFIRGTFARQALPMTWDFAECNPISDSTGNWLSMLNWVYSAILGVPAEGVAHSHQANVTEESTYSLAPVLQRDATAEATYAMTPVISSDPPYYDNIGYADLSDFFYIWLRRSLREQYPNLLSTMLTPKVEELIATPYRHEGSKAKAAVFFEEGLGQAILRWREFGYADMPTTIFYAFKQAETDTQGTASTGWETFLTGLVEAGFTITGTWPMRTERETRPVGTGTNALASSVVLSCVPRDRDASMATRREFINALKRELPDAMRKLQSGNIAPVDLAQAAIGPGMAVFSRYVKVIESDGEKMSVRTALALINGVLDEVLAEQEGEFDADTRWAVAWFEQYGMDEGDFGVAETLSKAKNTSVEGLVEAGLLASRGGKVQLLRREQLPDDWDPATDTRLAEWEATQYLIRALDRQGEIGAADLLRKLGGDYGEKARDLAYRLYSIAERKKWANEALAYNSLVIAWPEISKLARKAPASSDGTQTLFE